MAEPSGFMTDLPQSAYLSLSIDRAISAAQQRSHRYVTLEHLLLAMMDDRSAIEIMEGIRADIPAIGRAITETVNRNLATLYTPGEFDLRASYKVERVLQTASDDADRLGCSEVDAAFVLAALSREKDNPAGQLLQQNGFSYTSAVTWLYTNRGASFSSRQRRQEPAPAAPAPVEPVEMVEEAVHEEEPAHEEAVIAETEIAADPEPVAHDAEQLDVSPAPADPEPVSAPTHEETEPAPAAATADPLAEELAWAEQISDDEIGTISDELLEEMVEAELEPLELELEHVEIEEPRSSPEIASPADNAPVAESATPSREYAPPPAAARPAPQPQMEQYEPEIEPLEEHQAEPAVMPAPMPEPEPEPAVEPEPLQQPMPAAPPQQPMRTRPSAPPPPMQQASPQRRETRTTNPRSRSTTPRPNLSRGPAHARYSTTPHGAGPAHYQQREETAAPPPPPPAPAPPPHPAPQMRRTDPQLPPASRLDEMRVRPNGGQAKARPQAPAAPAPQLPANLPAKKRSKDRNLPAKPTSGKNVAKRGKGQGRRPKRPQDALVGRLVETIPRRMRAAIAERVEVRISREDTNLIVHGMDGRSEPVRHEIKITQTMSVALRAPDGGFTIEPISPETQWIFDRPDNAETYGRWRWVITPHHAGQHKLQLIIASRSIGQNGLVGDTAMPDQIITVRVRTNIGRTMTQGLKWIAAMIVGGVLTELSLVGLKAFGL